MSNQNEDLLSKENLNKAQARNLAFLETFAKKTNKVCGVPILQVMNYELIQVLNNMYLQSIIPEEEGIENESTGKESIEKESIPE